MGSTLQPKSQLTLIGLLRDMQKQLIVQIDQHNQEELDKLVGALYVIDDVATRLNDMEILTVVEEMEYAVHHAIIAQFKAEAALLDIEKLLSALEAARQTSA